MTVREFIKELETQAMKNDVMDENIISIGTGQNQEEHFYIISTEDMPYVDEIKLDKRNERKETKMKIVYLRYDD